jgi:hypothetical protein
MNAFLVLVFLVLGPIGPMPITLKMPWSSMEMCKAYIESPEQIEGDWGPIQVMGADISCEPRKNDEKPV